MCRTKMHKKKQPQKENMYHAGGGLEDDFPERADSQIPAVKFRGAIFHVLNHLGDSLDDCP